MEGEPPVGLPLKADLGGGGGELRVFVGEGHFPQRVAGQQHALLTPAADAQHAVGLGGHDLVDGVGVGGVEGLHADGGAAQVGDGPFLGLLVAREFDGAVVGIAGEAVVGDDGGVDPGHAILSGLLLDLQRLHPGHTLGEVGLFVEQGGQFLLRDAAAPAAAQAQQRQQGGAQQYRDTAVHMFPPSAHPNKKTGQGMGTSV